MRNIYDENMLRSLSHYSGVRREWRLEMDSWLHKDSIDSVDIILKECKEGLWGHCKG